MAGLFDLIAKQTMATTPEQTQQSFQNIVGGGAQALSPLMGRTSQPVSMGQVLAAAGGGLAGGMQQSRQQNLQQQQAEQQRLLVQQKMAEAKKAREWAQRTGQAMGLGADAPMGVVQEAVKQSMKPAKAATNVGKVKDPNSPTGYSYMRSDGSMIPNAPAPTGPVQVNFGDSGKKLAAGAQDRITDLWTGIDQRNAQQANLDAMQDLAAKTPTGAMAEWKLWAGQMGRALGLDVDMKDITSLEQFRAKQMDFVMNRIAGTKGAVSEKEMTAFEKAGPNIANTPEGNMIIAKVMSAQNARENELAMLEAQMLDEGASRSEAMKAVNARREELRQIPILSDDEYNSLLGLDAPSGEQDALPSGVSQEVWDIMTDEEKALF